MNATPSASTLAAASENVSCSKASARTVTFHPRSLDAAVWSRLESGGRTEADLGASPWASMLGASSDKAAPNARNLLGRINVDRDMGDLFSASLSDYDIRVL